MQHGTKYSQYWKEGTMPVPQFTSLCSSINKTSQLYQVDPAVFCTLLQWQVSLQMRAWLWLHSKEILLIAEGITEIKLFPDEEDGKDSLCIAKHQTKVIWSDRGLIPGDKFEGRFEKIEGGKNWLWLHSNPRVSRGVHVYIPMSTSPLLFLFQHEWIEQPLT